MHNVDLTLNGRKVLKDVNLNLKNGECVSVLGESGSGKHLIFNLIMRIYDRDEGDGDMEKWDSVDEGYPLIRVLGFKMSDVNNRDIREKIAFLGKEDDIFSGSVRENIDPKLEFSDDKIMTLLKIFKADEVIENASNGRL